MAECNCHEADKIYPNLCVSLSDRQQFRPSKINEIENYFVAEIKAHRHIFKKRYFEKYCSCDQACQVSAL